MTEKEVKNIVKQTIEEVLQTKTIEEIQRLLPPSMVVVEKVTCSKRTGNYNYQWMGTWKGNIQKLLISNDDFMCIQELFEIRREI